MLITNKFLLKNQECFFRKFITNLGLRVTELQIGVEPFQVQDWIHFVRHNRIFLGELLQKGKKKKGWFKSLQRLLAREFYSTKEFSDSFSGDQSQHPWDKHRDIKIITITPNISTIMHFESVK